MKIYKFYCWIILLLCLIFSVIGCGGNSLRKVVVTPLGEAGDQGYFKHVDLKEGNYAIPTKASVCKVIDKNISKAKAIGIAKKFNISGDVSETKDTFSIVSPDGDVFVDKTTGSYKFLSKKIKDSS